MLSQRSRFKIIRAFLLMAPCVMFVFPFPVPVKNMQWTGVVFVICIHYRGLCVALGGLSGDVVSKISLLRALVVYSSVTVYTSLLCKLKV